ncbi:arsenical-resistance protein [Seminavis robusta]|uniref:Arsenical-resistance protein n=1 Tax=Seminavis robusta TaxID=568900 RepID=A0A9N8EP52_9STRA|nr:arsenical-resistance protein [Seminavis robusta]|eukprot:Sro1569_g283140.1 arsenical-resistance protein (446) ;mRNA; f:10508-11845
MATATLTELNLNGNSDPEPELKPESTTGCCNKKNQNNTAVKSCSGICVPNKNEVCCNDSRDTSRNQPCCSPSQVEDGTCVHDGNAANVNEEPKISFFAKYLTIWIALAMILGTLLGSLVPSIPKALEKATVKQIWIPGAIFVWLMVYPMMLGVRWGKIRQVHSSPGGLCLTTFINWAVQPFLMYGLAVLFFEYAYAGLLDPQTQSDYIAGAVILGGSPCTAMVFVWSSLAHGDPNYTLAQVVLNDFILLFLYVPTTRLLLGLSDITLPWGTVFLSVGLFVVVPFLLGMFTHLVVLRKENGEDMLTRIQTLFQPISEVSLVLLVVFIFISQAQVITDNPGDVFLVMVPLILQTSIVFLLTYGAAYLFCLEHNIAGPAAFIGSSNFFELAVALAITVYGPDSGAVLVTVVGVLVEVPVMLMEVFIVNRTKDKYECRLVDENCKCKKA